MEAKYRLAVLTILATACVFTPASLKPAWAQDCPTGTASSWYSMWQSGQCVQWAALCKPATPSAAAPHYGAIAYGPKSAAWGYSYSWDSQAKAESTAMKNCAQHGSDCEVAVWFRQECGSVVSDIGANYYWGLGNTTASALTEARKTCAKQGGKICREQVSQCSR